MSWLSNIDKKQLALHVFFICLVGVVSAFTSIVLCICVNTSYRLNQEYSWLVFLLPVLGIVTLAFYKAMKLSYFYSTDDMVMEMRENKPVSPTLAPAILVGTCLSTLGGGAVGKESSAFQMGASIAYPFGIGDIIPRVAVPGVTPDLMLQVVLIGTLGGILGRFFGASLAAVRAWERKRLNHPYLSVFVVGIGITILVVAFGLQSFEGGGMNLLKQAASGSIGTWDFAIKAGLVFLALGSGFKGGEIMPTLVIGGLLGCSLGQLINVDPAFATAIGVMTFFAGMTRCPIAAFFLGFEVFGVEIIPFLAVSLIFAYGASHDSGYYGKGIRLNLHSARRRQRLAKQFIENASDVDSALAKLEEQANEFATEKEQAARKEAQSNAQASDPTSKPPNDAASHS